MGIKNKVIVIDPGHGGSQDGAIGLKGLKEKDVNLKVALYLGKLLKKEKANVILTREKDEEISLDERVKISKDANADLFLSIHHNANAQIDRSINRTEIYYPWEDDSPSLDVANLLFYYFNKYFKLPILPPLPAKYRVLRENIEPSVLGEACYISNTASEKELRSAEYNRLEAMVYFKSIIDYFEREIPRVRYLKFSRNSLIASFQDIDPSTVKLVIGSKEIPYIYDYKSNKLKAIFRGKNGKHIASVSARNLNGNITQPCAIEFFVDNPPEDIYIHFYPTALPPKIGEKNIPISLRIDVVDRQGNPVADNKLVEFKASPGRLTFDSCYTKRGRVNNSLILEEGKKTAYLSVKCEGFKTKKKINIKATEKFLLTGIVHYSNRPVNGAIVEVEKSTFITDANGRYYLFTEPGEKTLTVSKRGFYQVKKKCNVPDKTGMNSDIALKPIYNGLLLDKKIIVDPQDISYITLNVARHIKDFLYVSGADSFLIRNGVYEKVGEVERTRFIVSQSPERLICLSHYNKYQKDGSRCYYYYTDTESQKFAKIVQKYIVKYGKRSDLGVGECSSYMIIHSHCKRTLVVPGNLSEDKFREKLESYAYRIKEAYFIFCGILEDMGLRQEKMGSLMGKVTDKEDRPLSSVSVLVSNGQRLVTEENGEFRFIYLDIGKTSLVFSKEGKRVEKEITIKRGKTTYTEIIL